MFKLTVVKPMTFFRKFLINGSLLSLLAIAIAGSFTGCTNSEAVSNANGSNSGNGGANGNNGSGNLSMPAVDTTKQSPSPTGASSPVAPTASPQPLPALEIRDLVPYKHRSGILELTVPKDWQLVDNSQPSEILLAWNEKTGRATFAVNIFVPPSEIPVNRLVNVFETIIRGMYGEQLEFAMQPPVLESTGNVVIEWTSTTMVNNQRIKFQGSSKLQRMNNKFVIVTFGAIAPQFPQLKDALIKVANSQVINADLAIP